MNTLTEILAEITARAEKARVWQFQDTADAFLRVAKALEKAIEQRNAALSALASYDGVFSVGLEDAELTRILEGKE